MVVAAEKTSHRQILKATGILGGAQIVEIIIRIIRNKVIAVLLGPIGVGILGLYQSTIELIQSTTGFGLNFSAVRDIAEATGSGDEHRIARVILILRRWVWFTGLLGMVLTLVFCKPLSQYAFGDPKYAWGIAVLSVVLLLNAVSGGQLALLQGLRKISMMAQAKVLGIVAGFCITVPLYWIMGVNGIIPAIIITAVVSLFLSWFYSRKIPVQSVEISLKETFRGGLQMVKLGFFLVITMFANTAVVYIVRAIISNKSGIESVGQFHAAWSLSNLYLAIIFQAMAADYFPRLSAVNSENIKVVRLANEQTEIVLIIACPLLVGMLSFVSLMVTVLYSAKFIETVSILQWLLAGTIFKLISWPLSFILLAKGKGKVYVFTELCWVIFYLCPIYFYWDVFGFEITGMAYLFSTFVYLLIVFAVSWGLCGLLGSKNSIKHAVLYGIVTFAAFLNTRYVSGIEGYCIGCFLTLVAIGYSYYELRKIVNLKTVINKLLKRSD